MPASLLLSLAAIALLLAAFGLLLAALQAFCLGRHLRKAAPRPVSFPFISVLKPLCGVDDDLLRNLASFARLDYPAYEVLLGVKGTDDPAHELALRAAREWPGLMRVVVQRSSPGLNPKVNQLITLSAAARGQILVVSDSNIRVRRDYLRGIAAAYDDERVALVTHPVAGAGERSFGALLDNLQLCGSVAPGVVAAKMLAGKDLVVGKSMALRASDLRAMGGFERLKDVLAEDFLSGRIVSGELGRRVAIARTPVLNVSRGQCVGGFFSRYLRWSIMQRKAVGNAVYCAQILLNPTAWAVFALALSPGRATAVAGALIACLRAATHELCARALRTRGFGLRSMAAPGADLIVAAAWLCGFFRSEVNWRGNRLAVLEGTRLERVPEARFAEPQVEPG